MCNLELMQQEIQSIFGGICTCAVLPSTIIEIEAGTNNIKCIQLCCAHKNAIKSFYTDADVYQPDYDGDSDNTLVITMCLKESIFGWPSTTY